MKRRGEEREAPPSVGVGGVSDLSQGGPVVKDKAVSIGSGWGGGGDDDAAAIPNASKFLSCSLENFFRPSGAK